MRNASPLEICFVKSAQNIVYEYACSPLKKFLVKVNLAPIYLWKLQKSRIFLQKIREINVSIFILRKPFSRNIFQVRENQPHVTRKNRENIIQCMMQFKCVDFVEFLLKINLRVKIFAISTLHCVLYMLKYSSSAKLTEKQQQSFPNIFRCLFAKTLHYCPIQTNYLPNKMHNLKLLA